MILQVSLWDPPARRKELYVLLHMGEDSMRGMTLFSNILIPAELYGTSNIGILEGCRAACSAPKSMVPVAPRKRSPKRLRPGRGGQREGGGERKP